MIYRPVPEPVHKSIVPVHAVVVDEGFLTITAINAFDVTYYRMTVLNQFCPGGIALDLAYTDKACTEFWTGCRVHGQPYLYADDSASGRTAVASDPRDIGWKRHVPTLLLPAPSLPLFSLKV